MLDAVVVGAGPAGALLASELALCGLSIALFDSQDSLTSVPRGGLIHARTRQALARRGLVSRNDSMVSASYHYGCIEDALTLTSPAGEFGAAPEYWPQAEFARFLEIRGLDAGVSVYRGFRLSSISSTDNYVDSIFQTVGGRKSFRSRCIVGSDGADSTVRALMGFTCSVTQPTVSGVSFFVERTSSVERLPLGWTRLADGVVGVNRESDFLQRIMWLERGVWTSSSWSSDEFVVARVGGKLAGMVDRLNIRAVGKVSRFTDRSRIADSFRRGRSFIIGDAAHTQSPLGAQGTNLAVLDAVGLGWRLAQSIEDLDLRTGRELDVFLDSRRKRAVQVSSVVARQSDLIPPLPDGTDLIAELSSDKLRGVAELISGQDDPPAVSVSEIVDGAGDGMSTGVVAPRFLTNCTVETANGRRKTLSECLSQRTSPFWLYLANGVAHTRRVSESVPVRITPEGIVEA